MVYTKSFVIHSVDNLRHADQYIKNKEKISKAQQADYLKSALTYVENAEKTNGQEMLSGHLIGNLADSYNEMLATQMLAYLEKGKDLNFDDQGHLIPFEYQDLQKITGRGSPQLAHHLIQSFSPDDPLTPEEVHEIGRKTVMELTGGDYQFVIATHLDQDHLHNHIIFNHVSSLDGSAFRWQKGTAKQYGDISNKIASRYGAKIIEPGMKSNHQRYTKWQTENLYRKKIKARLDYLLANANSKMDFLEKAAAIHLQVDTSGQHTKFKLADSDQIKWTRARSLDKKQPELYQMANMEKRLAENDVQVSVAEVVQNYQENIEQEQEDFGWRVVIEPWQIYSKTSQGLYVNVDFGSDDQAQVLIYGSQLDELENGQYAFFVKDNDYYNITRPQKGQGDKRFIKGSTLAQQLSRYNGQQPIRKEPVIASLAAKLKALDFYAQHGDGTLRSGQAQQIEQNLVETMATAKERLADLDDKMVQLRQEMAQQLDDSKVRANLQKELNAWTISRDLLHEQYEQAVHDLDYHRGVHAKMTNVYEQQTQKEDTKTRGPQL
ncbi:relaxase/mobilization nuclease domain-containing protein [Fructobacillus tropaeoli]|uniref:relaxase/mobilization nuclease domain-containing protein n=1 Tax=Fructobacillus tropaeoli TaxID=709323 RepID=UPI0019449B58|nr:relaxase/mobilization nuclease domain-containing protein [Fructobacillus tropaeoli]GIC69371.1 relaxase/mobilization nuclease domain-containing protein [Fructobacillus tropaeoli]